MEDKLRNIEPKASEQMLIYEFSGLLTQEEKGNIIDVIIDKFPNIDNNKGILSIFIDLLTFYMKLHQDKNEKINLKIFGKCEIIFAINILTTVDTKDISKIKNVIDHLNKLDDKKLKEYSKIVLDGDSSLSRCGYDYDYNLVGIAKRTKKIAYNINYHVNNKISLELLVIPK